MCNKEQLVAYLYDELSAAERAAFDVHLKTCADCRDEVGALRDTRAHLRTWSPPQPEFTFHIAPGPRPVTVVPKRLAFVPRWAMAAAASLLVLAGAAAIANVELRYGPEGVVVRTGWGRPSVPAPAEPLTSQQPKAVAGAVSSEELREAVRVIDQRLAELERARTPQTMKAALPMTATITVPELRKILAESEVRQREEMALQVAQIWKDFSAARVTDFARLQDVIGRAQGVTNQQLRQHRESIESLYRVSASQR